MLLISAYYNRQKNTGGLLRFARLGASAIRVESSGEAFGAWRNDNCLSCSSLTKTKIKVRQVVIALMPTSIAQFGLFNILNNVVKLCKTWALNFRCYSK
jgi:hypothetical protein